ncbi:hypothetical protein [Streptomyces sp. N50]|uniref:hypothetical protein n=1 Tax=Streptomyces sp. N50 TaxID=3081765 RepID=UPI0029620096|nr:hypothetical protein [Streptomyces sp. N50]WOX13432.1 hypothetical protein R2B38_33425 [Streptomyces sp. N50]
MLDIVATGAEARDVLGHSAGSVGAATLTHNAKNGVTAGVRVVTAGDRTAVLKVLTRAKGTTARWAASDDPRHWNYWLREAEVYDSGLAQSWRPYGIRAPRLLARVERADGDVALWLERVAGEAGTGWPLTRYVEHARRLGAAQGAAPVPDEPWAFAGDGAVGEDLGNYLPDSVFDLFVPAADLPGCAARAYDAYLHGLRGSGSRVDERLVRLGVCASVVKYDWLAAAMLAFLAGWADEARVLAPQVGFPEEPRGG